MGKKKEKNHCESDNVGGLVKNTADITHCALYYRTTSKKLQKGYFWSWMLSVISWPVISLGAYRVALI
jgi:hypothetical protein